MTPDPAPEEDGRLGDGGPPPSIPTPEGPPPPYAPPPETSPRKHRWRVPLVVAAVVVVAAVASAVTFVLIRDRSQAPAPVGLAPQYIVNPIITVGQQPFDVEVDPSTHAVYVANFGDNSVSVIDGHTYAITTTITGISAPTKIAVDTANSRLYVTNAAKYGEPGTVTVVDTKTNTVVTKIPVGVTPWGSAYDADAHLLYVVNVNKDPNPPDELYLYASQPGSISVVDTRENRVVATVATGRGPQLVALDAKARRLYVTNEIDDTVSVIDTDTKAAVATIGVGKAPKGVTADADSRTVYVANFDGSSISVIDAATNTVRTTITTGNNPIKITVDKARKTIYTANLSPLNDPNRPVSASAIDAASFANSTITGVGKQPSAVAVDTANGAAYVSDQDGGKVYVIKPCYTCAAPSTPSK